MTAHRKLTALLLALCVLAGVRAAVAGEHPWLEKRVYYVIEFMGQLVEKGNFIRKIGSFDKMDCWLIEEEKSFYAGGRPNDPIRTIKAKTMTTFDGYALQRIETVDKGAPGREKITVDRGDAKFDSYGIYGGPTLVPVPPNVIFEITGEWLAAHRQMGGRRYEAHVLDRASRGVVISDVTILEREADPEPGMPSVWLAEIITAGRQPVLARYTDDGRLLRLEGGGMTYQVVTRDDFELGRMPGSVRRTAPMPDEMAGGGQPLPPRPGVAAIPIGMGVPAWDNFGWLRLRAEPSYDWSNMIRGSEYARVNNTGAWAEITALSNAPFIDAGIEFPMQTPRELEQFMDASPLIPSDHEAVIEAAYVAVADSETRREERNVLRAVSYLAGWINQSVRVMPWRGYDSSALETLASRSGDSLGHARLFASMARTLGVPTRVCQGFLAYVNRAVNHCWAEAWINGVWVPVDTTVSRVGLPAGYVLAERSDAVGAFRMDFANFMRNPALRLGLMSGGRETPEGNNVELVVGNRRTYAAVERDWMANLYWGFALRLPRDWKGDARLNSVELRSDDGQARVKCEALEGDFEAGEAELAGTVTGLRESLNRFNLIDARVVAFDDEGATPALFVEFTCMEGRVPLRCRQYVVPRRQRAFRVSFWAPTDVFDYYSVEFDRILSTFEF